MGVGSTVSITIGGTDVTSLVIASSARFEVASNATPGSCEFRVRDPNGTVSILIGAEIILTVDGVPLWGGYVTQTDRTFAFPVDVPSFASRIWVVRGVDYNILFDRRVLRNPSDLLHLIETGLPLGSTQDGDVLRLAVTNYADMTGFDASGILDVATLPGSGTIKLQQGWKLRQLFELYAQYSGAVWYIDPTKVIRFAGLESAEHRWGFSDAPNNGTITQNPSQYQGVTIGFRDGTFTEDGSQIVNDAFVWGGSEWSNGTVAARSTDANSIATYGRWQYAETKFGELGFGIQSGVTARADAIVFGPPGADSLGQQKGLRYSQWQARFTWFAHRVPLLGTTPNHVTPGALVRIDLTTFSKTLILPCRSLQISFPSLDETGNAYVEITGTFALQQSDPWTLWRYIRRNEERITTTALAIVTNSSTSAPYGAIGRFVPSPSPDGTTTVFTVPFGYIQGSGTLYLNGLAQRVGTDWLESNPESGQITLTSAPLASDNLLFVCRTLEG